MRATLLLAVTVALVLSAAGPVAAGPVTAGPVTAGPVTAGTSAAGPVAAGTSAAGPTAVGAAGEPPAASTAATSPGQEGDIPGRDEDACEPVSAEPLPNPGEDRLGWESGCWYDESIQVTAEDGLNETELDAVVSRAMARIEHLRQREFEETVPVEILTRSEFRNETDLAFENATDAERLHQNTKYEALFMVDENTDAISEIRENRGTTVLGFYVPEEDRIVVVSEDEESPRLDELTLAHELVHALQDQQFDLTEFERRTTEENNAVSGVIEGEARYLEHLYEQRCDGEWGCSTVEGDGGGQLPEGFNWGIYFTNFQPYSDGPVLVKETREDGGWDAVDALFGAPPASSEQVISPEKYPDEGPVEVTVEDRSSDRWHVPEVPGGVDYVEYGEAGIFSMFVAPTYETQGETQFVTVDEFVNRDEDGEVRDLDPLNYSHPYSDGWAGDRLYPYVTDESAETNETGYVWKTVWDSEADAREFVEGYERMLAFRGAEQVDGQANTYRIPDEAPYGDAFYVNRTGDMVVVVNAPTVGELSEVRTGAPPQATATSTGTPSPTNTTATAEPSGGR